MSFEFREPSPDSRAEKQSSTSEQWGQWRPNDDEDTAPRPAVQAPAKQEGFTADSPGLPISQEATRQDGVDPRSVYREHVTGQIPPIPAAYSYRPASMPTSPQRPGQVPSPVRQDGQQRYTPPSAQAPYQSTYPVPQQWAGNGVPLSAPGQPQQAQWQGYVPYGGPGQNYYPAGPYSGGYAPPYPGYPAYPYYSWQLVRPKRDGYQLGIAITALIGAILAGVGGLIAVLFLSLSILGAATSQATSVSDKSFFALLLTLTALTVAGAVGGSFSLYHSIRALLQKSSAPFKLPYFWIFVLLYLAVLGGGFYLSANKEEVAFPALTLGLIALTAVLPALALLAIGVRRLRLPTWTTTWRRFTLALTSGATLATGLALVFELLLLILFVQTQRAYGLLGCVGNPDAQSCQNPSAFNLLIFAATVIAPLVEETVKPLVVAIYIGRMRSAAEAFVLGMACGIGFDLIETVTYIGSGYRDWLNVAIERTGTGLLHGFGAAMVALGWYYLIRGKKYRFLKALGCWLYAVFQHALWNGTATLPLLPPPLGPLLNSWDAAISNFTQTTLHFTLSLIEILNIIEAILILVFFIYMTGRLRTKTPPPSPQNSEAQAVQRQQMATRG